jgi:hypothetical protein
VQYWEYLGSEEEYLSIAVVGNGSLRLDRLNSFSEGFLRIVHCFSEIPIGTWLQLLTAGMMMELAS